MSGVWTSKRWRAAIANTNDWLIMVIVVVEIAKFNDC